MRTKLVFLIKKFLNPNPVPNRIRIQVIAEVKSIVFCPSPISPKISWKSIHNF